MVPITVHFCIGNTFVEKMENLRKFCEGNNCVGKKYNHTVNGGRKEHTFESITIALSMWSLLDDA